APVLREAVEEDDGIALDVLHVARRAHERPGLARALPPDVVRVELVDEQCAVERARGVDPVREVVAEHEPTRGIARVRDEHRGQPAAEDLAPEVAGPELVAALAFEQDRYRREEAEDVE